MKTARVRPTWNCETINSKLRAHAANWSYCKYAQQQCTWDASKRPLHYKKCESKLFRGENESKQCKFALRAQQKCAAWILSFGTAGGIKRLLLIGGHRHRKEELLAVDNAQIIKTTALQPRDFPFRLVFEQGAAAAPYPAACRSQPVL